MLSFIDDNKRRILERIEFISLVGLGILLLAWGYITQNEDLKQWGVIGALAGVVIVLVSREATRGKILGPNEEEEAFAIQKRIFQNVQKFVKVVDPHPGPITLNAIAETPEGIPIQFLTLNLMSKKKVSEFEAFAKVFCQERYNVEIRYMPKGSFHDRFILTYPFGWHLGHAMKDLGKKITRIGPMAIEETETTIKKFDTYWSQSIPIDGDEN